MRARTIGLKSLIVMALLGEWGCQTNSGLQRVPPSPKTDLVVKTSFTTPAGSPSASTPKQGPAKSSSFFGPIQFAPLPGSGTKVDSTSLGTNSPSSGPVATSANPAANDRQPSSQPKSSSFFGAIQFAPLPGEEKKVVPKSVASNSPPPVPTTSLPNAGSPEVWKRLDTMPPANPVQLTRGGTAPLGSLAMTATPAVNPSLPPMLPAVPSPQPPATIDPAILAATPKIAGEPGVRKASQDEGMVPPVTTAGNPYPVIISGSLLTLDDAIRDTLSANPDLHSALHRIKAADEALANARAQFFPMLTLNDSYQASNNPLRKFTYLLSQGVPLTTNPVNNLLFKPPYAVGVFQMQGHFQQTLYAGGQRTAIARAAEAEREASVYSLSSARNKILFQVAESYYRLFEAREIVGVRRESVAQVESQLRSVQARLRSDSAVKADELKVQSRLTQVQEALANSENQYELAWAVLENVTGVHFGGRQLPDVVPPAPWLGNIEEVEQSVARAMHQRPELGELANQKLASEHLIRAAQGARLPVASFYADNDVFAGSFKTQDNFTFGLVLSLNLFDFGRTKSSVAKAQANAREVIAKNQRAVLDIELDVRRAALQLKDARERANFTTSSVSTAEENLRLFESRYQSQSATITDVLEAQVALSEARVAETNARAEIEISQAALGRAIGRLSLLGTDQPPPPH